MPGEGVIGKATPAVLRNSLRKQLRISSADAAVGRKERGAVFTEEAKEESECGHQADARDGRRPG